MKNIFVLALLIFCASVTIAQEESFISISSGFVATRHSEDDILYLWKNGYLINISYLNQMNNYCKLNFGITFTNYFGHKEYYRTWKAIYGHLADYKISDLKNIELNTVLDFNLSRGVIYPKFNVGIGCGYLFGGNIQNTVFYDDESDVSIYNSEQNKIFFNLLFAAGVGFRILDKLILDFEVRTKFMITKEKDYGLLIPFVALIKYKI